MRRRSIEVFEGSLNQQHLEGLLKHLVVEQLGGDLLLPHAGVEPAAPEKLFVRTLLDDLAVPEDDDKVWRELVRYAHVM